MWSQDSQERRASSPLCLVLLLWSRGVSSRRLRGPGGHLHLQSIYIPGSGLVGNAGLDVKGGGVGVTV